MNTKAQISVLAGALLACCCVNVNAQEKTPSNVLLIAIDNLTASAAYIFLLSPSRTFTTP